MRSAHKADRLDGSSGHLTLVISGEKLNTPDLLLRTSDEENKLKDNGLGKRTRLSTYRGESCL